MSRPALTAIILLDFPAAAAGRSAPNWAKTIRVAETTHKRTITSRKAFLIFNGWRMFWPPRRRLYYKLIPRINARLSPASSAPTRRAPRHQSRSALLRREGSIPNEQPATREALPATPLERLRWLPDTCGPAQTPPMKWQRPRPPKESIGKAAPEEHRGTRTLHKFRPWAQSETWPISFPSGFRE